MLIIVDSGSTKADWKIIDNHGNHELLHTIGFNPFYISSEEIAAELRKEFVQQVPVEAAKAIYFYGAGCSSPIRCKVIETGLQKIFPNARIEVMHDLLAAARATCFHDPGVACIVGTGSNSCEYNGKKITDNVSNLGYLVGDEGSGSHLGKKLIQAYFYRELPEDLEMEFERTFPGGKKAILNQIYGDSPANVYLASFAKFLSNYKHHLFVQKLVFDCFAEFIDRHVRKYDNHLKHPVHFIGSVVYHFREVMQLVLKERGMEMGKIIQKPIDNLVKFHLRTSPKETEA